MNRFHVLVERIEGIGFGPKAAREQVRTVESLRHIHRSIRQMLGAMRIDANVLPYLFVKRLDNVIPSDFWILCYQSCATRGIAGGKQLSADAR